MTGLRGFVAGIEFAQMWRVSNACYAMGTETDPNSVANDTTTHAYLLRDILGADLPQLTRTTISFRGGNTTRGAYMFGISDIPAFTLTTGDFDTEAFALANNSLVDETTNSEFDIVGMNAGLATLPRMGLMLSAPFQSLSGACIGATQWVNYIFPSVQMFGQFPALGDSAAAPVTFQVQPTFVGKFPNGVAFGANQGLADNKDLCLAFVHDYPLGVTTYVADGTETTFIAGYRPLSTTVTDAATPNWFAKNGTAEALSSIVTTTGVATMAAAGSAQDVGVLLYETQFVAI